MTPSVQDYGGAHEAPAHKLGRGNFHNCFGFEMSSN